MWITYHSYGPGRSSPRPPSRAARPAPAAPGQDAAAGQPLTVLPSRTRPRGPSSRQPAPCGAGASQLAGLPGGVGLGLGLGLQLPQPLPRTGSKEGGKPQQRSPRSPVAPRRRRVQVMIKHQGCRVLSSLGRYHAGAPPSSLCHLPHPTCHPALPSSGSRNQGQPGSPSNSHSSAAP